MMRPSNKKIVSIFILYSISAVGLAQSEGLTSSPYSLYGLGVINQASIGKTNGLGYSGIGLKTDREINNLNPANFALIPQNSFFYDVGVSAAYNTYNNSLSTEGRTNVNFSNVALAFRITDGLGAGIVMLPYSNVGYTLVGMQSNIEGSTDTFESNVDGLGGLSDLRLNLGYRIVGGLRLGLSTSLLFGNIEENESFEVNGNAFESTQTTNYSGVRVGFGLQYDLLENLTIGSTVQFPTDLTGRLKRSVVKTLDGSEIIAENNSSGSADSFNMPLELGIGFSVDFFESYTVNADYKKNYWNSTGQTENLGQYVDQDIFAFGIEYLKNAKSLKYGQRIRYRAGFNYDTGYLAINGKKIDGFNFTAGIGIPMGNVSNSLMNLSYSYGAKGQLQNVLIREKYHLISLNLSLEDIWFRKRKIN